MRRPTRFETAARPFGLVSAALLVFLMLHTTVAVLAREFLDHSMMSLVEVSELMLIGIIFIALPGALLRDETIVVDLIDNIVPKKVAHVFYLLGLVMTLVFLAVAAYAMIEPAVGMYHRDQYTMVMEIDRFNHWLPILFGFYGGILGTVWLFIHRLRGGEAPVTPREIE